MIAIWARCVFGLVTRWGELKEIYSTLTGNISRNAYDRIYRNKTYYIANCLDWTNILCVHLLITNLIGYYSYISFACCSLITCHWIYNDNVITSYHLANYCNCIVLNPKKENDYWCQPLVTSCDISRQYDRLILLYLKFIWKSSFILISITQVKTYFMYKDIIGLVHTICRHVKGDWPDHFWIHPSKWSFWYQIEGFLFLVLTL